MKLKNLLFIGVAVLFAFSSCNRDNDSAVSIVGTWKYDTMEFDVVANDPATTLLANGVLGAVSSMLDMTIVFREDGTYTATISGIEEIIPELGGNETNDGVWSLENGRLIIDGIAIIDHRLSRNRLTLSTPPNLLDLLSDLLNVIGDEFLGMPGDEILEMLGITRFNMSVHFNRQ